MAALRKSVSLILNEPYLEAVLTDTRANRSAKINRADHGNGSGSSIGNNQMQAEQYQVNVTITKVGNNII